MEDESRGRFKVSAANPTPSEQPAERIGRFRLMPQGGSPFLQRGRFSVIPEEETGSPQTQSKLMGPKIVVDPSPEWDFVSIKTFVILQGEIARTSGIAYENSFNGLVTAI